MKITILALSVTSSWGNGHATTYRALARALNARGHRVVFFERDQEWYASNRDMPEPPFCPVHIYDRWEEARPLLRREMADSDVVMVGSYFPDAMKAIDELLDSAVPVKAFYDIDTPITVAALRKGGAEYLKPEQVVGFDLYFSFTGGPLLRELESRFGAKQAVPLYCSFDPDRYRFCPTQHEYQCDLSYMGTYAPDRQGKLEELLCIPARQLPERKFIVAGPQYPASLRWPANVKRIVHLEPKFHPPFYCSSRMTLNLTRAEMVQAGYSPSVRLFEAAGCGTAILSDSWPGLGTFFELGKEILIPSTWEDVVRYLDETDEAEIRKIGLAAQERVMSEHTSQRRAQQFEEYVSRVGTGPVLAKQ